MDELNDVIDELLVMKHHKCGKEFINTSSKFSLSEKSDLDIVEVKKAISYKH